MTSLDTAAHYDEETLIRVAESETEIEDPHLTDCDECRTAVDQYRDMLFCLDDDSPWDHRPIDDTPNPQTIATLRSFVEEMHREDAEAEPLVAELLAGSREEWMPRLMSDAKFRTAGVVRKLIAMMPMAVRRMPADALAMTALATAICDSLLSADRYPARVAVGAWRERAYVLFYVGEIAEARAALGVAEARLERENVTEHDAARIDLVKALIFRQTEDFDDAITLSIAAERSFERLGEISRAATARSVIAYVLSQRREFRAALEITRDSLSVGDALPLHERATLTMNAGYYERELGNTLEALRLLELAEFMFEESGSVAEAARVRWNVAALLRTNGQVSAAESRMIEVIGTFENLGMRGTAAVALLELAEIHLERREYAAAEALCRRAMSQFAATGLEHSSRAMTAIAYLNECCHERGATPEVARRVRNYVRALPRQPELLFVPTPDTEYRN